MQCEWNHWYISAFNQYNSESMCCVIMRVNITITQNQYQRTKSFHFWQYTVQFLTLNIVFVYIVLSSPSDSDLSE